MIHEDCEPSEQRRPKIQVRRVYILIGERYILFALDFLERRTGRGTLFPRGIMRIASQAGTQTKNSSAKSIHVLLLH